MKLRSYFCWTLNLNSELIPSYPALKSWYYLSHSVVILPELVALDLDKDWFNSWQQTADCSGLPLFTAQHLAFGITDNLLVRFPYFHRDYLPSCVLESRKKICLIGFISTASAQITCRNDKCTAGSISQGVTSETLKTLNKTVNQTKRK